MHQQVQDILDILHGMRSFQGQDFDAASLSQRVPPLARLLLELALSKERFLERESRLRLSRLMEDDTGKHFLVAFTDQALRSQDPSRSLSQIQYLMDNYGIPSFFSSWEQWGMRIFSKLAGLSPKLSLKLAMKALNMAISEVTVRNDDRTLGQALMRVRKEGAKVTLNHLGEAILSDQEAKRRLEAYHHSLKRRDIEAIAIKLTTLVAQLDHLNHDHALPLLEERLGRLYLSAYEEGDKLVMLDMEAYSDLGLTLRLFQRLALSKNHLKVHAGMVLQAYLPDSALALESIIDASRTRIKLGGRPLRVRLVKGANLAMEQVEASISGYKQAPYEQKSKVDANFKRLLIRAAHAAREGHLEIGLASHNLFDLSFGLALKHALGLQHAMGFEMLYGIAPHLQRALLRCDEKLYLYVPAVDEAEIQAAVGYLVRRLDENTGKDNFLRDSFAMKPSSTSFQIQKALFLESFSLIPKLESESLRRLSGLGLRTGKTNTAPKSLELPFENEANTDWSLEDNKSWIEGHMAALQLRLTKAPLKAKPMPLPPKAQAGLKHAIYDPSSTQSLIGYQEVLHPAELDGFVTAHVKASSSWKALKTKERAELLLRSAALLRERRGELMALMAKEAGKSIMEADVEVSEAIDFAEYYARSIGQIEAELSGLAEISPLGCILVAPPWNFPMAIPAGGIFAALATGNSVIFKPAPETSLIGHALATLLFDAGVPESALAFLPLDNLPTGKALIQNPLIDAVILTGSTATAKRFLEWRKALPLFAETGGKNAIIGTDMADRDLLIQHTLQSAFYHAGQKCSAASLLILEAPLYDDPGFRQRLKDATESLQTGSSWEIQNRVTPLIRPPQSPLKEAYQSLDEGESWLVRPEIKGNQPQLMSPGIKFGVKRGSRSHLEEFFGPILSVMRAKDLDEAIEIANEVPYGLTSGLESLDRREKEQWKAKMDAGCLYLNRPITGAIVERQAFGGVKLSSFGPGHKAGGPNYLLQFLRFHENAMPDFPNYDARFLSEEVDRSQILGEHNIFRYKGSSVFLRFNTGTNEKEARFALAAYEAVAKHLDLSLTLSAAKAFPWLKKLSLEAKIETPQKAQPIPASFDPKKHRKIRALGDLEPALRDMAQEHAIHYDRSPVSGISRLECLKWVEEQSISDRYHRFGHLG